MLAASVRPGGLLMKKPAVGGGTKTGQSPILSGASVDFCGAGNSKQRYQGGHPGERGEVNNQNEHSR